jgi:hypothetical protein
MDTDGEMADRLVLVWCSTSKYNTPLFAGEGERRDLLPLHLGGVRGPPEDAGRRPEGHLHHEDPRPAVLPDGPESGGDAHLGGCAFHRGRGLSGVPGPGLTRPSSGQLVLTPVKSSLLKSTRPSSSQLVPLPANSFPWVLQSTHPSTRHLISIVHPLLLTKLISNTVPPSQLSTWSHFQPVSLL